MMRVPALPSVPRVSAQQEEQRRADVSAHAARPTPLAAETPKAPGRRHSASAPHADARRHHLPRGAPPPRVQGPPRRRNVQGVQPQPLGLDLQDPDPDEELLKQRAEVSPLPQQGFTQAGADDEGTREARRWLITRRRVAMDRVADAAAAAGRQPEARQGPISLDDAAVQLRRAVAGQAPLQAGSKPVSQRDVVRRGLHPETPPLTLQAVRDALVAAADAETAYADTTSPSAWLVLPLVLLHMGRPRRPDDEARALARQGLLDRVLATGGAADAVQAPAPKPAAPGLAR